MRIVCVQALKSFDDFVAGEVYWLQMTETLAHLIVNHYLRLLHDTGPED
jgi:hypothetical protein